MFYFATSARAPSIVKKRYEYIAVGDIRRKNEVTFPKNYEGRVKRKCEIFNTLWGEGVGDSTFSTKKFGLKIHKIKIYIIYKQLFFFSKNMSTYNITLTNRKHGNVTHWYVQMILASYIQTMHSLRVASSYTRMLD